MDIKDNYTRKALVTNVVDGDTIDVEIDLGYYITTKERVRLLRINTPEKYGETKEAGLLAKEFTTNALLGKEVFLVSYKTDSFKRWLGEVYYYDNTELKNISDELLERNLATTYMA